MKKITLALLGYGVVGQALEKLYLEEKEKAREKYMRLSGQEIDFDLKWIFLRDKKGQLPQLQIKVTIIKKY
ncbi:MAG TPA: hypothetical protein VFD08_06440 [Clostridia bacterium]|nr:hypothetical protein [Clostridia bacterium]